MWRNMTQGCMQISVNIIDNIYVKKRSTASLYSLSWSKASSLYGTMGYTTF
jgi:hypothetical protein